MHSKPTMVGGRGDNMRDIPTKGGSEENTV